MICFRNLVVFPLILLMFKVRPARPFEKYHFIFYWITYLINYCVHTEAMLEMLCMIEMELLKNVITEALFTAFYKATFIQQFLSAFVFTWICSLKIYCIIYKAQCCILFICAIHCKKYLGFALVEMTHGIYIFIFLILGFRDLLRE